MNDWTQYAKVPTPIYKKNKYIPKSPNIVSGLLQQQLINKVKELINFNKIKYYVLHTKQDLQRLTKEFFVSPKINGIPCIFMATTIDCSFYTFTFSINDYLSNRPIFHLVKIQLNKEMYKDTVFEGILAIEPGNEITTHFYITDCLVYSGAESSENIRVRLTFISNIISGFSQTVKQFNTIRFSVVKIHDLIETGHLFKTNNKVVFFPFKYGERLLFIGEPQTTKNIQKATFEMVNEELPDVYSLHLMKDGKLQKFGYAYIPTIDSSHKAVQLCSSTTRVLCQYHKEKNKWEPLMISDKEIDDYDKILDYSK